MNDVRFIKILEESNGFMEFIRIYQDRETGVHYLMVFTGSGLALTPLLSAEGVPVITPTEEHA